MRTLVPFATWAEVMAYVRAGLPVWYRAPLDYSTRLVRAEAKARTIRVKPWAPGRRGHCAAFDAFTADDGHLGRFFHQVGYHPFVSAQRSPAECRSCGEGIGHDNHNNRI